jgi:dTDP-4-amino-4,6-dideoxygalactose transaminase
MDLWLPKSDPSHTSVPRAPEGAMHAGALTVRVPVCRPLLAGYDRLAPWLQQIDQTRSYTNNGPLHDRLAHGLARHFGLSEAQVCLSSSGTAALVGAIFAHAGPAGPQRPLCLCPDFTFVATAVAARSCGYTPLLADCDPETWALTPAIAEAMPDFDRVGLVVVVAPMGRMVDLVAWQAFSDRTGRPVVVDAAACFDTLSGAAVAATRLPVVLSLHATKTYSTGEGGLVLCGDPGLVHRTAVALNFGFDGTRESRMPAINGKLSEYHAAIGLAELDGWPHKRAGFVAVARHYAAAAEAAGLAGRIVVDAGHAVPYAHLLAPSAQAAQAVAAALRAEGIDTRFWYGRGIHAQQAFAGCPRGSLDTTADVSGRLLGLPCYVDLDAATIAEVVGGIARGLA